MFYRKKPIVIEAERLWKLNNYYVEVILRFMEQYKELKTDTEKEKFEQYMDIVQRDNGIIIKTIEGDMLAREGDYVIRGVNGEYYPCNSNIFEKTYEQV